MRTIISPAKNMKVRTREELTLYKCRFPEKTETVIQTLKKCTPWDLESYMKINEKLAGEAFADIQAFSMEKEGTAAVLTYDGLVFKHMDAVNWDLETLHYAQEHLRILSACYGALGALDEIQPYRLEMQCKIPIEGHTLYEFWGNEIYQEVYRDEEIVLNLASEEYAKCVRKYAKKDCLIDVEFLTMHKGKLKTLATLAKMARGHMVQYVMEKRIEDPEDIKKFDWNGYIYEPSLSNEKKYVFVAR